MFQYFDVDRYQDSVSYMKRLLLEVKNLGVRLLVAVLVFLFGQLALLLTIINIMIGGDDEQWR